MNMNEKKYVVLSGNKQYFLESGEIFKVDRLDCNNDEIITLPMIFGGKEAKCKVINSFQLGDKILIQKKNRRKGYEKRTGFRAQYTILKLLPL